MTDSIPRRGPIIETVEPQGPPPSPQDAPPLDLPPPRHGRPVRRGGLWARIALAALGALVPLLATLTVYAFVESWIERLPWLGWTLAALTGLVALALAALALGELAALARLRRVEAIRRAVAAVRAEPRADRVAAAATALERLYAGRADLAWARQRLAERADRAADAETRLDVMERELMAPLDAEAAEAVSRAAGGVASATALMPSALLDAAAALYFNLAMIRRVALIYGGRAGALGSLRLARKVVTHAMAAGLIALGDDLLEPLLGGGVASKLSRRMGEGVVNGAMTARIGLAAMDVCRPMPYHALARPKLRDVAWRALKRARPS